MEWIVAWEQAQKNLSDASKGYDRVRMLPAPVRSTMGRLEYADRRRRARDRLKLADQTCIKLKQMKARPGFDVRTTEVIV